MEAIEKKTRHTHKNYKAPSFKTGKLARGVSGLVNFRKRPTDFLSVFHCYADDQSKKLYFSIIPESLLAPPR